MANFEDLDNHLLSLSRNLITITDITTIINIGRIILIPIAEIMSDMREMFLILYM